MLTLTARTSLQRYVGKVISEHPYVKILSTPRFEEYEVVPGLTFSRWEALAQVNESLAVVELKVAWQEVQRELPIV